jgi:predicted peptidase
VVRDTMPFNFQFKSGGPPTAAMRLLLELLDEHKSKPYIDQRRLYVGGLSMGGMGTLELLRRRPHTFAAAIAICGGDKPANASKYADKVSIWLLHGEADPVVPAHYSIEMAEELRKLGADVKLTTYPGVGHSSWEQAFAEPDLLPWLFSKQKAAGEQDGKTGNK